MGFLSFAILESVEDFQIIQDVVLKYDQHSETCSNGLQPGFKCSLMCQSLRFEKASID